MSNRAIEAALEYHRATNHSPASLARNAVALDYPNKPLPYKIYTTLAPIPLPGDLPPSPLPPKTPLGAGALDALAAPPVAGGAEHVPDLAALARLCHYANGVTKHLRRPGGAYAMRAAACTGALFHLEVYVVCGDLPGLAAGVYHYGAHDDALRLLRVGDYRRALVEATGHQPAVSAAPAIVVLTDTFWRNAWKYRARAYRHTYWDAGTILANLLAVAAATALPAEVVLGYADAPVDRLLDVDGEREAAVALVALGRTARAAPPAPPVAPLDLPTERLSPTEVDYPPIRALHAASSLASGEEAAEWRGAPPPRPVPPPAGELTPLHPLAPDDLPRDPVESVIRRRGSTRRFTHEPITRAQLATALDRACRPIPADCTDPAGRLMSEPYLIVGAIAGLAPGAYRYRQEDRALELLRAGDYREEAGFLALDQALGADAAVNVYFLARLEPILARFGNRGYRAAQLEAAIAAGRIYLASYAQRFGATGLTFFDDDVTAFFGPSAAGMSVLFLVALGHKVRRGGDS
ncbi:MAG TPA: SagB/ThcOx family dehydrogenase [Thermomicrobiales bacterium]|nr:SagB/ThcOx family dehydrogenase [Thermomicrobiales bacterium]